MRLPSGSLLNTVTFRHESRHRAAKWQFSSNPVALAQFPGSTHKPAGKPMARSPKVAAPCNGFTPRIATTEKNKNTVMQMPLLQCRYTISNFKKHVTTNFMLMLLLIINNTNQLPVVTVLAQLVYS